VGEGESVMSVLEVDNLSQSYGGLKVLQNVSFSLEAGERVGLIGPNGAGKTTLLNVLCGLVPLADGRIYIDGHEVTRASPDKRVSLGLGRSFQINTLFTNLSLLDNSLLAVQGTKSVHFHMLRPVTAYNDSYAAARQLLEPVGLWEKRNDIISALSHGEQRQVEILLALASKPKLLLLDEPSAGLTSGETAQLVEVMHKLLGDVTLFFAAHDMDLVFALASRVVVLYYGQIIAQGTPEEIQTNPKVREIYLGTGGRNA